MMNSLPTLSSIIFSSILAIELAPRASLWLVEQKQKQEQKLQRERNGALFGAHGVVHSKVIDSADIVREAILRQQSASQSSKGFRGSRLEN
jgi:hypothetical protein